jgi:hypothetical protein
VNITSAAVRACDVLLLARPGSGACYDAMRVLMHWVRDCTALTTWLLRWQIAARRLPGGQFPEPPARTLS